MDFLHLKRLMTLVDVGNMTKAADMMHISQPALSRQITQIEEEIGYKLFIRDKKRLVLTREGETFIQYSNEILSLFDKMAVDLRGREEKSHLSIACTRSLVGTSLGTISKMLLEQSPDVRLIIYMRNRDEVFDLIDRGEIDIGLIIEQEVDAPRFLSYKLNKTYRWGLLMNQNDPLTQEEELVLSEIVALPLILPDKNIISMPMDPVIGRIYREARKCVAYYDIGVNGSFYVDENIGYMVALAEAGDIKQYYNKVFRPIASAYEACNMLVWSKKHRGNELLDLFIKILTIPHEG